MIGGDNLAQNLSVENDVPTNIADDADDKTIYEMELLNTEGNDNTKLRKEGNEETIVYNNGVKITVSSVGTLDLRGFIMMAMNLPSFNKRIG